MQTSRYAERLGSPTGSPKQRVPPSRASPRVRVNPMLRRLRGGFQSTSLPDVTSGSPTVRLRDSLNERRASFGDRFISAQSPNTAHVYASPLSVRGASPAKATYDLVLRSELMDTPVLPVTSAGLVEQVVHQSPASAESLAAAHGDVHVLQFMGPSHGPSSQGTGSPLQANAVASRRPLADPQAHSLSPLSSAAQRLLRLPRTRPRKIARRPFKVLEAPSIQDDFYLSVLDWSSRGVVAVALGSVVYLWDARTAEVQELCRLECDRNTVRAPLYTSVSWMQRGTHLALGTSDGKVHVWNVEAPGGPRRTLCVAGHEARVGSLAWNGYCLATGSRDASIAVRDLRASQRAQVVAQHHHAQEVCGLRWCPDGRFLASGGNDNKLCVWDSAHHADQPLRQYREHNAAVKAIDWSPHQRGILASGGGTADRCICMWDTRLPETQGRLSREDTGSQVCNLKWSKSVDELVSTHGYSQNQIVIWSIPSMTPLETLTGHTMRVLYLAMSPDGQTIVTGAGDETLRFWNVFPGPRKSRSSKKSQQIPDLGIR